MEEYVSNSNRAKKLQKEPSTEGKKEVKKVISGTAKVKKKSEASKLADVFIAEDVRNVRSYILMDVLVPAIKNAISAIVTDGIDMILFGGTGHSKKRSSGSGSYGSYVSYNKMSDSRGSGRERTRRGFDLDNITFDYRADALEVLEQMEDVLEKYGTVSVADLYDMAGLTAPYTSNNYGWDSLRTAEVARTRDGDYVIKLPKAYPIK